MYSGLVHEMLKESEEYDWTLGAGTPSGPVFIVFTEIVSLIVHPPVVQAFGKRKRDQC